MDYIKEAFQKVKQDIDSIKQEISSLKENIIETKENITGIYELIKQITSKKEDFSQKTQDNNTTYTPTHNQEISTTPTHTPTHNTSFNGLKHQNIGISIGNRGVPTDRQTDRQTDQHTQNSLENIQKTDKNTIENASELLDSLDNIKKQIRLQFKSITDQELLVFSTIYQLDEEFGHTDYKTLSKKLNLSESSIRDYVGRLINKAIPVEKIKINNKNIQLKISENLKKIVSLSTILQLRDL